MFQKVIDIDYIIYIVLKNRNHFICNVFKYVRLMVQLFIWIIHVDQLAIDVLVVIQKKFLRGGQLCFIVTLFVFHEFKWFLNCILKSYLFRCGGIKMKINWFYI